MPKSFTSNASISALLAGALPGPTFMGVRVSFRVTNAAIFAALAIALATVTSACSPPTPHTTLTQLDAGFCRPGALDSGAQDDGDGGADGGTCAPTDAAAPDHQ